MYSIDENSLTGEGYAVTLTLRRCPPTHEHWKKLREAYFDRIRRSGFARVHWVTEWQRRGVPHLHCAIYLPKGIDPKTLIYRWIDVSSDYGPSFSGQHMVRITKVVGWLQYVAKHASRGLGHYQRSPENIPKGWEKTGRMWGKLGDWPTREAIKMDVPMAAFWQFRRIVRRYRIADARQEVHLAVKAQADKVRKAGINSVKVKVQSAPRIRAARTMLKSANPSISAVRGVSEWIEMPIQVAILEHLSAQGHVIDHAE